MHVSMDAKKIEVKEWENRIGGLEALKSLALAVGY